MASREAEREKIFGPPPKKRLAAMLPSRVCHPPCKAIGRPRQPGKTHPPQATHLLYTKRFHPYWRRKTAARLRAHHRAMPRLAAGIAVARLSCFRLFPFVVHSFKPPQCLLHDVPRRRAPSSEQRCASRRSGIDPVVISPPRDRTQDARPPCKHPPLDRVRQSRFRLQKSPLCNSARIRPGSPRRLALGAGTRACPRPHFPAHPPFGS